MAAWRNLECEERLLQPASRVAKGEVQRLNGGNSWVPPFRGDDDCVGVSGDT